MEHFIYNIVVIIFVTLVIMFLTKIYKDKILHAEKFLIDVAIAVSIVMCVIDGINLNDNVKIAFFAGAFGYFGVRDFSKNKYVKEKEKEQDND